MADRIISLLRDPVYAREMGKRGQEKVVERFQIEATVKKTEALFEKLVSRKGRP